MAQNALPEPETLYARLNSLVADNPLVYGAAIAFEPFAYQEDTRLFSPYVYRDGRLLQALDIGTDSQIRPRDRRCF